MPTGVKVFDFATAADWMLTNDAAINASDQLTLTDPEVACAPEFWDPTPTKVGDEWKLAHGQVYIVRDNDGTALSIRAGHFRLQMRKESWVGAPNIDVNIGTGQGWDTRYRHDETTGWEVVSGGYNLDHVMDDAVSYRVRYRQSYGQDGIRVARSQAGGWLQKVDFGGGQRDLDKEEGDARAAGGVSVQVVNGTSGDLYVSPDFAHYDMSRYGLVRQTETAAWPLPADFSAPLRAAVVYDQSEDEDGIGFAGLSLYYLLQVAGSWSSAHSVDADGGLTGAGADWTNATHVRWQVVMSNWLNYTARPTVSAIDFTYTENANPSAEDDMRATLAALQSVINADVTVKDYTGWDSCHITSLEMALPANKKCGVWLSPDRSETSALEDAPISGTFPDASWAKTWDHTIEMWCVWRVDESSTEDMMVADSHHMAFTDHVIAAVQGESLSDTVQFVDVSTVQWEREVAGEDLYLVANVVTIRVRSDFYGVTQN